jgi:putative endonuclease
MKLFDKPKAKHLEKGDSCEQQALIFLQQQGLKWRASNYRCKIGELDLVMMDGAVLVIVEVRYRKSEQFGGALASITRKKQARIIAATQHYAIINNLNNYAIRFDVVAVSGVNNRLDWIKNAFQT